MDYLIEKFDESDNEVRHISKQEIENRAKRRFRYLISNSRNRDIFEAKTQVKMEFSPQTADGLERLNRKLEFNIDDGNILEAYEQFLDGWLDEELERIFGNALKGPERIMTLSEEKRKRLGSSDANKKVKKRHGGEAKRIREEHSLQEGNKELRKKLEKVGDMIKKLRRALQ